MATQVNKTKSRTIVGFLAIWRVTILVLAACFATDAVAGTIVFQHSGSADPISEGWGITPGDPTTYGTLDSNVSSIEVGPLAPDSIGGLNAWGMENQFSGGRLRYELNPTTAPVAWTLRARVRVAVEADALSGDSNPVDAGIIVEYSAGPGGSRYALTWGADASGNAIVGLFGTSTTYTVAGGNVYHLYELTSSGEVYVDGALIHTGYVGIGAGTVARRFNFGDGQTSALDRSHWNLVEWEEGSSACSNGIDDDGDGLTDHSSGDPSCQGPGDATENNPDEDSDGLLDGDEINIHGTDPTVADTDADGLDDGEEVNTYGTDPLDADSDSDGLLDGFEVAYGFDPLVADDSSLDSDSDGLDDLGEQVAGSNPTVQDTDGDGLSDGDEVHTQGTDPIDADTDGDRLLDGFEVAYGFDPLSTDEGTLDPDSDGLDNIGEQAAGTDPFLADTDSDGLDDGVETTMVRIQGFTTEHVISTGSGTNYVLDAADLDGDADQDVLMRTSSYSLNWLPNSDGVGTFGSPVELEPAGNYPTTARAADLDGDGDVDVVASTNYGIFWYENTDGMGAFGAPRQIEAAVSNGVYSLDTADLDGDGDLDLVTVNVSTAELLWYENSDGSGAFGAGQIVASSLYGAYSVTAADLDGDGDVDIAAASYYANTVVWFENLDGAGTYAPEPSGSVSLSGAISVQAVDLDADGDKDLLVGAYNTGVVGWLENLDGLGTFGALTQIDIGLTNLWTVVAADLDTDGDLDVVAGASSTLRWYENTDGAGTMGPSQVIKSGSLSVTRVAIADMDGDGDDDVIATGSGTLSWFVNPGTNPLSFDTDGDGLGDGDEVNVYGTDPSDPDSDGDGLTDGAEVNTYGTDPTLLDSDGDGVDDGDEVFITETDPAQADAFSGSLYAMDYNSRKVLLIDEQSGQRTTVAGPGIGPGTLIYGWGISPFLGSEILVADAYNNQITRVNPNTGAQTVLSSASVGSGTSFSYPLGVAVEGDGAILVLDYSLAAVLRVDPGSGDRVFLSAANLPGGGAAGSGPAFVSPYGLDLDAQGIIYVANTGTRDIVRVDPGSGDRTVISGPSTGSGPIWSNLLNLGFDKSGQLWAVSYTQLFKVDATTGTRTLASDASTGSGPVPNNWIGLTFDELDRPLVSEYNDLGRVMRIDPVSGDRTLITNDGAGSGDVMVGAYGLTKANALDQDGDGLSDLDELSVGTDPLVADTDGDGLTDGDEVNIHGSDPLAVDSDGDGLDDGDEVNTYLTDPTETDSDEDGVDDGDEVWLTETDPAQADPFNGSLYAMDYLSRKVLLIDEQSGQRTTVAGPGIGPGTDIYGWGITLFPGGDLLVADAGYDQITRVDPATGSQTVLSGAGIGSGPAFSFPLGVAVENDGQLLVVDYSLRAVLRVDPETGDRVFLSTAVLPGGGSAGGGPAFVSPYALDLDAQGIIYVADASTRDIVRVEPGSGDRTVISGPSTGSGPIWSNLGKLGFDEGGQLWAVSYTQLFKVDATTGARTLVSDASMGSGPVPSSWFGLTFDGLNQPLVAEYTTPGRVMRIDPGSGDRTLITNDGAGSGDAMTGAYGLTRVGALDQDGDGLSDLDELNSTGTDPLVADTDGDGALDAADNCPLDFDSSQADFDADGEGDICDADDGRLLFNDVTSSWFGWQAEPTVFDSYSIYRGDLADLQQTGVYSQPAGNPAVAQFCGLPAGVLIDGYTPQPGQIAFYIVAGNLGGAESPEGLGRKSDGTLRPHDNVCPGF